MPRVSDEHLEARRRQILDAARRRFAANGFHATSMQDILAEAGLSAGGVYRYFASKEDIIAAIAEEAIGTIRAAFESAGDEDLPILEVIGRAISAVDERARHDDLGRLALQVWAEAARSAPLRRRLRSSIREARAAFVERIGRQYGPEVDAEALGAVVIALLPGYVHATVIVGDVDPDRFERGLEALAAAVAAS